MEKGGRFVIIYCFRGQKVKQYLLGKERDHFGHFEGISFSTRHDWIQEHQAI